MPTQVQHLQQELIRAEANLGEDDPFVKALRQQLDGYRSMEVNREQNLLIGTVPALPRNSAEDSETEADGKELGAKRIAKFKHQNEQLRKGR